MNPDLPTVAFAFVASYFIGSIPFAYIIVKTVTGQDVTAHGTGNVGAMNVRRSTGSWGWFAVAMIADAMKGIVPVATCKIVAGVPLFLPASAALAGSSASGTPSELMWLVNVGCPAAVTGSVLGHNYSVWMALIKRRFVRTGKGLATGGGALLAYDWRYFVAVVVVGLAVIAITRYMMAGQVAAALTLPTTALILGAPDWPFALAMGLLVYAAHHKRFVGLLQGKEPKFYIEDRMGPRG
jgi:glycerol-3-phosphate acyltransferase PlsY